MRDSEPVFHAFVPAGKNGNDLLSPTQVTHSVRRPKSPRVPQHLLRAQGENASPIRFPEYDDQDGVNKKESNKRARHDIRPFTIHCRRQVEEDNPAATRKATYRTVASKTSAFQALRTPQRSLIDSERSSFSEPEQRFESKMEDCMKRTKETCGPASIVVKNKAQDCAKQTYHAYEHWNQKPSTDRGEDAEFFVATDNDGDKHERPKGVFASTSVSSMSSITKETMQETPIPPEKTIRDRSGRFPEAALLSNPVEKGGLAENPQDDSASSDVFAIPSTDESPSALREVRLHLFRKDHDPKKVPRARLTRAMAELTIQDGTILNLHEELEATKESLQKSQDDLKAKDSSTKKYEMAIQSIQKTSEAENKMLAEKLTRERLANAKLLTETSKLKALLHNARDELTRQGERWRESREDREGPSRSQQEAADKFKMEKLLNQVNALKSELVLAKSHEARTMPTPARSVNSVSVDSASSTLDTGTSSQQSKKRPDKHRTEIARLRIRLDRSETELARRKDKEKDQAALVAAEKKLKEALWKSNKDLSIAKEMESRLRKELEKTSQELRATKRAANERFTSKALDARLAKMRAENERSQSKAMEELTQCRVEAEELKKQVKTLASQLQLANKRVRDVEQKRVEEKKDLTKKLTSSKRSEQSFKITIDRLEAQLAKAEQEAASRGALQTASVEEKVEMKSLGSTPPRSPKASQQTATKKLEEELQSSRAQETALRGEVEILKGLLQQQYEDKQKSVVEAGSSEEQIRLLDRQVKSLKEQLEAAESQVQYERVRSEEERRVATRDRDNKSARSGPQRQPMKEAPKATQSQSRPEPVRSQDERRVGIHSRANESVSRNSSERQLMKTAASLNSKLRKAELDIRRAQVPTLQQGRKSEGPTLPVSSSSQLLSHPEKNTISAVPPASPPPRFKGGNANLFPIVEGPCGDETPTPMSPPEVVSRATAFENVLNQPDPSPLALESRGDSEGVARGDIGRKAQELEETRQRIRNARQKFKALMNQSSPTKGPEGGKVATKGSPAGMSLTSNASGRSDGEGSSSSRENTRSFDGAKGKYRESNPTARVSARKGGDGERFHFMSPPR